MGLGAGRRRPRAGRPRIAASAKRPAERPRRAVRSVRRRQRSYHRRRAGALDGDAPAHRRCTSAAWAARRTTITGMRWRGAVSPEAAERIGALARGPQRRSHDGGAGSSISNRTRCSARRRRIRRRWEAGVAGPGVTGLDRWRTDQLEALELMADLAGTSRHGDRMTDEELILVDTPGRVCPAHHAQPARRSATRSRLRCGSQLLEQLRTHDNDPDVRVTIIRGAGAVLLRRVRPRRAPLMTEGSPFYSAPGDGQWARQANDTWFSVWDLAKPVIAQIHGYAIAGATELASACDLVYVADDARDQLSGRARRRAHPTGSTTPCSWACGARWNWC